MSDAGAAAPPVALVHDYLTQRGGAERVVLSMLRAFPGAPVYTSLYAPSETFPEFGEAEVRASWLNHLGMLRQHHRWALPLLAPTFASSEVRADVVLCSSSGWAHSVATTGRKVVYCYTPARWLYQSAVYEAGVGVFARTALRLLRPSLLRRDRLAAGQASRYVAVSTVVRDRIRAAYGLEAEVLPPPLAIERQRPARRPAGIEPGFFLLISRLLSYKNVGAVVEAFAGMPARRLVIVGAGPEERRLRRAAPPNTSFEGVVADDELRWLYCNARGVLAASYEDFGLTPLEGASFGVPSAVLRWGGYLDTVVEDETGVFFDSPCAADIRRAVSRLDRVDWDQTVLRAHAAGYSESTFIERLREIVAQERAHRRGAG
jgi:glycosyltransferase involved in cell wall biosynthesis